MSTHILKNEFLTLQIDDFGAELISIINNKNNIEYLWNGDPQYWKRHSPIHFLL
jgi:galactose mutarotase-like enzyme